MWNCWRGSHERIQICVSGLRSAYHRRLQDKRRANRVPHLLPKDRGAPGARVGRYEADSIGLPGGQTPTLLHRCRRTIKPPANLFLRTAPCWRRLRSSSSSARSARLSLSSAIAYSRRFARHRRPAQTRCRNQAPRSRSTPNTQSRRTSSGPWTSPTRPSRKHRLRAGLKAAVSSARRPSCKGGTCRCFRARPRRGTWRSS